MQKEKEIKTARCKTQVCVGFSFCDYYSLISAPHFFSRITSPPLHYGSLPLFPLSSCLFLSLSFPVFLSLVSLCVCLSIYRSIYLSVSISLSTHRGREVHIGQSGHGVLFGGAIQPNAQHLHATSHTTSHYIISHPITIQYNGYIHKMEISSYKHLLSFPLPPSPSLLSISLPTWW